MVGGGGGREGDGMGKRDCHGCRARILNCQKFYGHGADEEPSMP